MRCALTITGNVQNAGYRGFIEERARERRLKGYIFNDTDGSVQLLCDGAKDVIDEFVDVITLHEEDIFVENISKTYDPEFFPIPTTFNRIQTDTMGDFGRKLDKGVKAIKSVKKDTVLLHDIKKDTVLLHDIKKDTCALVDGQDKMVKILKEISNKL